MAMAGASTTRKELALSLSILKNINHALSSMNLKVCNGGVGEGISFSQASVLVDFKYHTEGYTFSKEYGFTDIFEKGNSILMDYIKLGKKPNGPELRALEALLSFISRIEEASKALQVETQESEGTGRNETDWAAKLAIHFFSPLSLSEAYVLDNHSMKKKKECPCPCKEVIRYGDTSIGNSKTWYGRFDILIGKRAYETGRSKRQKCEANVDVGATVVPENVDKDSSDDDFSDDTLSQIEVKSEDLKNHLSQLFSQTIVFSFYEKKCHPFLNLVPYIGVSKSHIQFHFYDSQKDIYLASKEMPLFYVNQTLRLPTVIATWLVLNFKHLLSEITEDMEREGKFGFHSQVLPESLNLYKTEIEMGLTVKPKTFQFMVANYVPTIFIAKKTDAEYE
ncbi:uncharacterized protein LOC125657649 [Ostrea edulis]|uniref:uncharacterized protein LOC125657649 n=1 Tax=Ostrea edulis TaxID=37623 RepID=UPI0024B000E2|nr:uncharacterized protein LOC125657649 [Ostrea edulis]